MKNALWFCVLPICVLLSSRADAATIAVKAGGDLQTALNTAKPGDIVTLEAGSTLLATSRCLEPVRPHHVRSAPTRPPGDDARITPPIRRSADDRRGHGSGAEDRTKAITGASISRDRCKAPRREKKKLVQLRPHSETVAAIGASPHRESLLRHGLRLRRQARDRTEHRNAWIPCIVERRVIDDADCSDLRWHGLVVPHRESLPVGGRQNVFRGRGSGDPRPVPSTSRSAHTFTKDLAGRGTTLIVKNLLDSRRPPHPRRRQPLPSMKADQNGYA